jgi:hypothetical protein
MPLLKAPLTRAGRGGAEGGPSAPPLFSAFSLPCEIRPISQGRPCSASEHTRSVERKQGKGMVTGFPGGAPPPSLPCGAGEGSLQASPLAGKLLHDKSCRHPWVGGACAICPQIFRVPLTSAGKKVDFSEVIHGPVFPLPNHLYSAHIRAQHLGHHY